MTAGSSAGRLQEDNQPLQSPSGSSSSEVCAQALNGPSPQQSSEGRSSKVFFRCLHSLLELKGESRFLQSQPLCFLGVPFLPFQFVNTRSTNSLD